MKSLAFLSAVSFLVAVRGTSCGDGQASPIVAADSGVDASDASDAGTIDAAPPTCSVGGFAFEPGQFFPDEQGCNICECGSDGGTKSCTAAACSGAPTSCTYKGEVHQAGAYFPAGDGCNVCACGSGVNHPGKSNPELGVVCSARTCP